MKNLYLLIFTAFISMPFLSDGQSIMVNGDMEQWDNPTTPTGWVLAQNISQESTIVHGGSYSAGHTSAGAKKLKQVIQGIVPGNDYTISLWYYDNTDAAKIKLASSWLNASGQSIPGNEEELSPPTFNPDDDQWHQYSAIVTAPADAAKLKYFIKVLDQGSNTGGTVYYDDFYFGSVVLTPEPSNYPSDFSAETHALLVSLSWVEDTIGPQLPEGYLIVGVKDGFTADPPVDGTPVDDDTDWSDGIATVNVTAGINSYEFTDLEGITGYTFTIYPYTNAGAYIDYKTDGTPPDVTATTIDAEMISFEGFETGTSGSWSTYNVLGDQEWIFPQFNGKYTAKMYGYSGGSFYANEDWLISPLLDLSSYTNVYYSFKNIRNSDGELIQLLASTDYDGVSDPNTANWDNITDSVTWSSGSYEAVVNDDIDLSSYLGGTVYFAFKYTSTDVAAVLYKLDNMQFYSYNLVPTIEVTYPNGGETLVIGASYDITWEYENWVEDHLSVYLTDGTNQTLIAEDVPVATGAYIWTITTSIDPGDYKIYLEAPDGTNDMSDDFFTIVAPGELVADFVADTTVVIVGDGVTFTDLTNGNPTSWLWTFEGGTPATYDGQQPPLIIYNDAGVWDVTLEVSDGISTDVLTMENYISSGYAPVADFEADNTELIAGTSTNFTSLSTGDDLTYSWTFEGGTPETSTEENPSDIYYNIPVDSTYDVTLTVSNIFGESTITKQDYISVTAPEVLIANFDSDTTIVVVGNGVTFTDQTIGSPTSWLWTFEGGTPATYDGQQPPQIIYNDAGVWDVTLEVSDGFSTDVLTMEDYITSGYAPVADFEADQTEFVAGSYANFTSLSTGDDLTYSWTFEGGTPETSSDENPSEIYYNIIADSTYDVTLTVSNMFGESTLTKEDYIHTTTVGTGLHTIANISVYPNPANGSFLLNSNGNGKISVIDIYGNEKLRGNINSGTNRIDVSGLAKGIYFLNTTLENGSFTTNKIMIE